MNLLVLSPYVFNTPLTWYSVFVLTGAIVAYLVSNYFYHRNPESKKCPDLLLDIFLVAFPCGLLGGRIWYILSELEYYRNFPIEMLKVWEGGLAIQGGVMLGAISGILFGAYLMKKHNINLKITTVMDMVIPNILIAQVIGRWGNFFNQEVYGACVTRDKLSFLPNFIIEQMAGNGYIGPVYCKVGEYAQPLFLYEGILNLIGFILISIVIRKFFTKRVDGTLTGLYFVWYGVVRACLEGFRNEEFIMRWGKISQSVVTSIAFVLFGLGLLIYLYVNHYLNLKKHPVSQSSESINTSQDVEIDINAIAEKIDEKEESSNEPINVSDVEKNVNKKTKSSKKKQQ